MGIQGLLPLLSSIQKYAHLRDFAGQVLGVDAYGWLHRGTFTCATELAQGKPCRAYVDFALSRVRMLQHFGVIPYLVFDGGRLPSKAQTEKDRSERRKEGRRKGLAYLEAGKSALAYQELQKSIDVTPQMARNLIEELKSAGVKYVVAPYEADSQLAYLERRGIIAGILSEDSDLLVFGANVLVTKLDQYGECVVYRKEDFTKCREISLVNWSSDDFRMMAILSGCDYLPGIPGVGLKSAYRLVRQHKTIDKIVRMLQFDGKKKIPSDYLRAFHDADRTFLHQWVYCPESKQLVNLNPLPHVLRATDLPFIGAEFAPEVAVGVAHADLHPSTKKPLYSTLTSTTWKKPQRSVQATPDLKEGKSIADFFKPVRTPLAELDPNAFTPSPSQQRLLASQQGRSWSARSTPTNQQSVRAAMKASPLTSRTTFSQALKPAKQRLCAETPKEPVSSTTASPYFGQTASTKKTKKQSEGFDLYSDDSICDALQSTTKAAEVEISASQQISSLSSPKKRKRFDVFQDNSDKRRSMSTIDSSASQSASFCSTIQSESSVLTAATTVSMSSFAFSPRDDADCGILASLDQDSKDGLTSLKMPVKYSASRSSGSDIDAGASTRVDQVECSSPHDSAKSARSDIHRQTVSGNKHRALPLGSEDMLVPESPSSLEDDDGRARPKLDLGGFAFG